MEIVFSLRLPTDVRSVPAARRLCRSVLVQAGASVGCTEDILLALTEACANVVRHGGGDHGYDVTIQVTARLCRITVVDSGQGFDPDLEREEPDEGGRGIALMRSLVDRFVVEAAEGRGTAITLEKHLEVLSDSLLHDLSASEHASA
jgi:anti-sigma regulatory factor (Ser/Thr protein kinase)